jgi:2-polyprenyl-3-methyl-5-hydroxy-6-metoxy-1,4-benzoquinol methylase
MMLRNGHYQYSDAEAPGAHAYIRPVMLDLFNSMSAGSHSPVVIDLGCGNGSLLREFGDKTSQELLFGLDGSQSGIEQARRALPGADFRVADVCGDLSDHPAYGKCDFVFSTEVVEHLFDPVAFARNCFSFVRPGGRVIITTPYHGYLKHIAIAVCGKTDFHFHPLLVGGHIKFWSRRTLSQLLETAGLKVVGFRGVGRFSGLWKSMVLIAERPGL